jgi:putative photosynthetic complex assembly protein 2
LWLMRQSAKLNIFLGVRNLNEGFLPPHLRYLQTYFRRQRMNLLFPLSVSVSTGFAVALWRAAIAQADTGHDATRLTFLAALMSLAILEHWFMVLPLPSEALWKWGMRSHVAANKPAPIAADPTLP